MKKTFPCGHRGLGRICHRCADERRASAAAEAARAGARAEKDAWEASFAGDPIDLRDLPERALVTKTREILRAIAGGDDYTRFHGKRLSFDRGLVSVPIGKRYRLLLRDEGGVLRPIEVLTHEAYNNRLRPG
ncbi:MAG: hypothetical protein R3B09_00480 [Nannocystaceae bacterium]